MTTTIIDPTRLPVVQGDPEVRVVRQRGLDVQQAPARDPHPLGIGASLMTTGGGIARFVPDVGWSL